MEAKGWEPETVKVLGTSTHTFVQRLFNKLHTSLNNITKIGGAPLTRIDANLLLISPIHIDIGSVTRPNR